MRNELRVPPSRRRPTVAWVWILVALSVGPLACSGRPPPEEDAVSARTIEEVLEERTPEWMSVPGVVGTGIGLCDGSPCLVIFVSRDPEGLREELPHRVEGYAVDLRRTGRFEAQDTTP